ncbi:MAG: BON domain-containing protein [Planctomycetaceae bacterium]|nr:BON domain-containing protein [Planctomycetaceae bacterium]
MNKLLLPTLLVTGCLCADLTPLAAQTRSNTGATTGGGNVRANTGTTATSGQRGGTGTGRTAATGQADTGINTDAGSSASINREFGDGFIGRSDSAGRFVGNEQAAPQRLNQQTPDFGQRPANNGQGGQASKESQVRPTLRIAFDTSVANSGFNARAPLPLRGIEARLSDRLATSSQFAGVQISTTDEGSLLLQGSVRSEQDRRLAEAFLRLEPGVKTVDNQLLVLP